MGPEDEKFLNEMRAYVTHLRYRLAEYQFHGIDPPPNLLSELKMAQRLVILGSKDPSQIDVKV